MLLLFLPLAYSGEPNQTEPTEFIFMVQCVSLQQSNSTIKDSSWRWRSSRGHEQLLLCLRSGAYVLQRRLRDVYRRHDGIRPRRQESDWHFWNLHWCGWDLRWDFSAVNLQFDTRESSLCDSFFFFWSFLSLVRRGHIWVAEQEQPFWPEPCGSAWSHHSLCGLLLDFPQHREWRSARPRGRNR